ncbi:MAG: hypothetical protein FJ293_17180, partial [Planctomycetes bacterium]|nr:hypothetical protein [Planctomycetota bacterium]
MSARDAARATARAVARPTRFAVLLPVEVLHALHAATGCDVVTVYLSNPAAPHDRASYVLLGQSGASAAFSPYLRGPLRPQSLERFSAHDRVKALLVPDVRAHAAFRGSVFCRHHAIRSVARLSVRLPTTAAAAPARRKSAAPPAEPPPVPGALPPFLEVFLSWRRPRENGALAAASAAAKSLLLKRAESLLADPELRLLMDPRAIAVRHRKLQRIADRFHDDHLPAIDSSAASAAVARAIEACCRAVAELLDGELFVRKGDDRRISFWWLDRWGARPSDHDPRQFFVHPPPRTACGSPPAAVAA